MSDPNAAINFLSKMKPHLDGDVCRALDEVFDEVQRLQKREEILDEIMRVINRPRV